MKGFYNNTIMSGAFSKVLRVFALLCVLFGISGTAWGDEGFFDKQAWNLQINGDWESDYGYNSSDQGTIPLGNLRPIEATFGFWAKTYKNGGGNVTQVTGHVRIEKSDGTLVHDYETYNIPWKSNLGSNGDQYWEVTNLKFSLPTNVGNYKLIVYLIAYNGDTKHYLSNNGNNYIFTFNVAAPPTLGECEQIIFQLDKGNANQNDGWNGSSPKFYAWDCNGNSIVSDKNAIDGKYIIQPGSAIPYGINFVSEHDFSGNKGKTGDIIGYNQSEFQANKKYTIRLTGEYEGNGYDRVFKYTMSSEDAGDICDQEYTYALAGTFNNWNTTANTCTIKKGTKCVHELELEAGTYELKVLKDGSWYSKNGARYAPNDANGVTTTVSTGDYDNITLVATNSGIYTFTMWEEGADYKLKIAYQPFEEPVLISRLPKYDTNMENVDLYGYVQKTLCADVGGVEGLLSDYGFVICPGSTTSPCIPDKNSQILKSLEGTKPRGAEFSYKVNIDTDRIIPNAIYGYRAYAVIDGKMYLSEEVGTFMLPGECIKPAIDFENMTPIEYTIDASLGAKYADDCNLVYGSLQTALDRLLSIADDESISVEYKYTTNNKFTEGGVEQNSIDLNVPIIFNIMYYDDTPAETSRAFCYQGNTTAGVSGGGPASQNSLALIIKDINRNKIDNTYTLTLRNGGSTARPWLHHVILRNSRDVVLDNLAIFSDPNGVINDDALELDINSMGWDVIPVGGFTKSKIVVKNCMIGSNGFTGVHASAYDDVTFENNEFEIVKPSGTDSNVIDYGASAKFLACTNIKFTRNNFRGAHATLLWIQECENMLVMNNVFWNTNEYAANAAAIRLVTQFADNNINASSNVKKTTKNLGFYYNTFFLQDDKVQSSHLYDFLHYSSLKSSVTPTFSNIEFMYNNCYSYDANLAGKSQDPTTVSVSGANYCPNNFWSEYDKKVGNTTLSAFAFGNCAPSYITDVSKEVCKTTATGPASLVVSGTNMNKGKRPGTELAQKLGVADDYHADRYNDKIRPETVTDKEITNNEAWTFGAYQSRQGIEVRKIYWLGLSKNWDDRNNWGYFPSENTDSKSSDSRAVETPQRLSCINHLSDTLYVVIPEQSLLGMNYLYPEIPASFAAEDRENNYGKIPASEQVTAGLGVLDGSKLEKFANTIELEYGAGIKGVENLGEHYGEAVTHFIVPRKEWILVGTVVKPRDETNKQYRDLKSGDYYIKNQMPHVYMHEAYVDVENSTDVIKWDRTFTSLEISVPSNEVFAIQVADQYGKYKYPADLYNFFNGTKYDGNEPVKYTFRGKFVNDNALPSYQIQAKTAALINNSYPCNINARELSAKGNVQYYDYDAGAFLGVNSVDPQKAIHLKPQHGFYYKSNTANLDIDPNWFVEGNTRMRSAQVSMPTFSLNLYNAVTNRGYSNIVVREDELLLDGEESIFNVGKAFAQNEGTPEMYIFLNDGRYSSVDVASELDIIPLGIRILSPMMVRFEKSWFTGFSQVILYDKQTGKEYNLLETTYTTETLQVGEIEGRFFLNLEEAPVVEEPKEEGGNEVPTEVVENEEVAKSINIFVEYDNTIKVITNGVELQTIYVSDMAGRSMKYDVKGCVANLKLSVAEGVYTINVIGDTASRTEKVILK